MTPEQADRRDSRTLRLTAAAYRFGWLALLLAASICAVVVITTIVVFAPVGRAFADWITYVNAAERVLAGAPIYPSEQLSGPYVLPNVTLFGYAYPPSSVPLFIPFISYPLGLVLWLTLNVGLLITGLYAVLQSELGRVRALEFAPVLLGLAFYRGFADGVAFGNASVGLAGVLAWSWVIGRGHRSIGVVSAVAGTIKLVPGVIVFWSDRQTFLRTVITTIAVGMGLAVVTLPLVGIGSWFDYVRALSYSEPACGVDFPVSLACTIQPLVGIGAAKLAGIALALVAGGLAVVVRPPLLSFSFVAVAWLAPVTDLHSHYLLVVYVLVVVACARFLARHRRRRLT